MAITKTKLLIEVNEPINTIATAVQLDSNSRFLDVFLYDKGLPIDLTEQVVRIHVRKPDGTTIFNQGEITDAVAGRCQFALTSDMLNEAQSLETQISIWNSDTEILSTKTFKILVSESLRNDEEVEATNEFGVLVVLFSEIQNALELMQYMTSTFGEPGERAAGYGVNTFWGMLEYLAMARGGVKSVQRGVTTAAGMISIGEVNVEKSVLYSVSKGSAGTVAARGTVSMAKATVSLTTTPKLSNSGNAGTEYISTKSENAYNEDGVKWTSSGNVAAHTGTLDGGTTDLIVAEYSAVLTSPTTIECDGPVEWQLVEHY